MRSLSLVVLTLFFAESIFAQEVPIVPFDASYTSVECELKEAGVPMVVIGGTAPSLKRARVDFKPSVYNAGASIKSVNFSPATTRYGISVIASRETGVGGTGLMQLTLKDLSVNFSATAYYLVNADGSRATRASVALQNQNGEIATLECFMNRNP